MAKQYEIKVKVDLTQSDQALARQDQALEAVERKHRKVADTQETQAKRGAKAQFVSSLQLEAQAEKLSSKIATEAQKATTVQAREAKRAADAKIKEDARAFKSSFVSSLQLGAQAEKLSSKIADQAQKAADAQTRSAQKTARDQARESQKIADSAQKAADVQAKAAQQAAQKASAAQQRAADAQVKAAQKAAQAKIKEDERAFKSSFVSSLQLGAQAEKLSSKIADQAERQSRVKIRESERAEARIKAMAGRALTDEEARAQAQGMLHQRANDKRVATTIKALEKERVAGQSIAQRTFGSLSESLATINPVTTAMAAGAAVAGVAVQTLVKHWADVAKYVEQAGKATTAYQEKLAGNAAVKGHLGDTTLETKESLRLRTQTLQSLEEQRTFEGGLMNMGAAAIGTRITQTEFDRVKEQAGLFQAAEGGDAKTHGELVGRLPDLMRLRKDAGGRDVPLKSGEVMAQESKLYDILQLGGAEFTPSVEQLLKNSSLSQTGLFHDINEQAGLQSFYSKSRPREAGEMVDWATRATLGNLGRMRGVEGNQPVGQYLQGIGAKVGATPPEILKLISDDMKKQEATSIGAGKAFSPYDYLQHQGFTREEDIKAILPFFAGHQAGEYAKFEDRANAPASTKEIDKGVAKFRTTSRGQSRMADISQDAAQFTVGQQQAKADALRRAAHAKLVAEGKTSRSFDDDWTDFLGSGTGMINSEVNRLLQEGSRRAGVQVPDLYRDKLFDLRGYGVQNERLTSSLDAISQSPRGFDLVEQTTDRVNALVGQKLDAVKKTEDANAAATVQRAVRAKIPNLIAAPGQAGGPGPDPALFPGIGGPLGNFMGLGAGPGALKNPDPDQLPGLVSQLIDVNRRQLDSQEKIQISNQQMLDRDRANTKQPPAPQAPLPVQGPGAIPRR